MTLAARVIISTSLLLLAACVSVEGQSSGKTKRALLDSYLFRSADIFYPDGLQDRPDSVPNLKASKKREIKKVLVNVLKAVETQNLKMTETPEISMYLRPAKAVLHLTDSGQPISYIDQAGEIFIDVKIAQAFYRTALVSGLMDSSLGGANFMEQHNANNPPDEVELLSEFLALKQEVESTRGKTMLGDLFEMFGDDAFEGSWFKLTDVMMTSSNVEGHYFGTMTFLIAHEYGHGALGHLEQMKSMSASDCETFHEMEYEADQYGLLMLSSFFTTLGINMPMFGLTDEQSAIGYRDFFKYTYDMAGFATAGVAACSHPDPMDRLKRLDEDYTELRKTLRAL